jgi:hypothetical protein
VRGNNKVTEIVDHVIDNALDITALTETWLDANGSDSMIEGDLCPPGFKLLIDSRRIYPGRGRGGGVGVLFKAGFKYKLVEKTFRPTSFEYMEVIIYTHGTPLHLIVLYRPPPSVKNKLTVGLFCDEFTSFLEDKVSTPGRLCIVGDFNFHVDNPTNSDAQRFCKLLDNFDLLQHVQQTTHERGHTLDLIITCAADQLVQDVVTMDTGISDHFWIHCSLSGPKPKSVRKQISYRKIKAINTEAFVTDIRASPLSFTDSFESVHTAVDIYNTQLSNILDKHAPLVTKSITLHPEAPWFNEEIREAKKERRKAELIWRKSGLTVHRQIYLGKKENVNFLIKSAKESYYSQMIADSNDQKTLFKVVEKITHKKSETILPEHTSPQQLANQFGEFFTEKIKKIRTQLMSTNSNEHVSLNSSDAASPPMLDVLAPATTEEVRKIVNESKVTSCKLDPVPTSFLKVLIDVLLPILTNIVNLSFKEGSFPSNLKKALIVPLLKKTSLDPEIFKHYRPVSNLAYISKLIERVAAKRLLSHMSTHKLHELYQSAYKQFHSSETALLRIHSDILAALDNKKCVLLIMLDLSAAFDTVDHTTLISRLASVIGVTGKALDWFTSYLKDRFQSVLINGVKSQLWELLFGVPQGSVLGPILFIIYTSPLGKILQKLGIKYHFYADDSQLYISFDIHEAGVATKRIEEAVTTIKEWMSNNFLCLNEDKTEILLIASPSMHKKVNIPHLTIGSEKISPTSSAKNIGFIFDNIMGSHDQISLTSKSAWHQLRIIGKLRQYLDNKSTEQLVHAFVSSKLDINNALLYGLPDTLLHKFQVIQNAAARIVMRLPKYCHITPVLQDLHWLPVKQRIMYKILLTVFKALNNLAPAYITDLLARKSKSLREMRSDSKNLLIIPKSRTVGYGDRNFKVAGPILWNMLPDEMRACDNLDSFKTQLKTYLYHIAYD